MDYNHKLQQQKKKQTAGFIWYMEQAVFVALTCISNPKAFFNYLKKWTSNAETHTSYAYRYSNFVISYLSTFCTNLLCLS